MKVFTFILIYFATIRPVPVVDRAIEPTRDNVQGWSDINDGEITFPDGEPVTNAMTHPATTPSSETVLSTTTGDKVLSTTTPGDNVLSTATPGDTILTTTSSEGGSITPLSPAENVTLSTGLVIAIVVTILIWFSLGVCGAVYCTKNCRQQDSYDVATSS